MTDLEWEALRDLRIIRWVRTAGRRQRVHDRWIRRETRWEGAALTTADAALPAETVYQIMHHRWDWENCGFHQLKTAWRFDHCFGHQPGIIETLVGLQCLALSVWRWWQGHHAQDPAIRQMPLIQLVEDAWVAGIRMRTARLAWWAPGSSLRSANDIERRRSGEKRVNKNFAVIG